MGKYYLIGIKGSGMASLACLLNDLGNKVVGSDVSEDFGFEEGLKKRDIEIHLFNEQNIKSDYIYIIGNAYDRENIEVKTILDCKYKYYYYPDFIKSLSGMHIAIAGTHGKTTTTKMLVDMLQDEKIAYIIGDGTGGAHQGYKYLIYEACEYKDHFLSYHPDLLVVNKVELDHPDYFSSIDDVYESFRRLIKQSQHIIMKDDNGFKKRNNMTFYGSGYADYPIKIISENSYGYVIEIADIEPVILTLPVYGRHMIDNFMAAYVVMRYLGYPISFIKEKVRNIVLPKRRMEEEIINNQIIIKDYAHHPTEIKALYDSLAQKYPERQMCVFFQPHTYSRTLALSSAFNEALDLFDEVYIADTFSSKREVEDKVLQKEVDLIFNKYPKFNSFEGIEMNNLSKIYIFLGAGNIYQLVKLLSEKNENK